MWRTWETISPLSTMNCMRSKNSQGSQVISFSRGSGPRRKWSAIGFWAGPGVFTTSAGLLLTDQQQLDELESSIAGSASLVLKILKSFGSRNISRQECITTWPKFSGGNRLWHRRGGRRILPRGPTDFCIISHAFGVGTNRKCSTAFGNGMNHR